MTMPPFDPSPGRVMWHMGRWVEWWAYPNGIAWRDPELAARAVAAWQRQKAEKMLRSEPSLATEKPVVQPIRFKRREER